MSKETKSLTLNPELAAFQESLIAKYEKANQTARQGQTVFVGSSLMEIFPIEQWEESGEVDFDQYIYNRAVRATTTAFLLAHIDAQIFDLAPSKIFINIGTNDIGFEVSEGQFLANEREIFRQIAERLPGCETYALRYYPINTVDFQNDEDERSLFATRSNAAFQEASDKIEALAQELGFHFVDVNAGLADESGKLRKELTFDGAHLNPDGYRIVLANLTPYL
ncbi:SGNH/GDSL hydrolase family protein [Cellulomonas sp. PhB150]|uniref:SGNH/GDSL hydrolase family protein n=1 Tax=Cellulomonas sp. PhB150 TaxID=2485188 RepID=UPI000F483D35|nr:SGNH/GDSL hydrolase family protein [Cellulomonas sp. PhB150]ROS26283.1 lysophospholipase L1-like esterase [Cellulomonas sp. PhB150]